MMAARKIYVYTVQGTYPFPIDMLRYDRATPDSEVDSGIIEQSFKRRGMADETLTVKLLSDLRGPTEGRWESFGWRLVGQVVTRTA